MITELLFGEMYFQITRTCREYQEKSPQIVSFYSLLLRYKKRKCLMKYVGQKLSIAVKINIVLISNIWNVLFLFESNDMIFHICNWTLFLFLFSFRKVWWSSQKSFNHAVKGFENSFWDFIFFYMKAILKRPARHLNCSW